MGKNEVMTFIEWFKENHHYGNINEIGAHHASDYAEYYHQSKQSIPVDVEKAINDKYPLKEKGDNEWYGNPFTVNEFSELKRNAAHFGYQLNRQVIDWEKIKSEFNVEFYNEFSYEMFPKILDWFRSRISASSDGWISVKDKLPEVYKDVNAWRINKEEVVVAIWNGNEWEMNDEYDTSISVSHWQYVPAAPPTK